MTCSKMNCIHNPVCEWKNYNHEKDKCEYYIPERPLGEWIPIKTRPLTDEERLKISKYFGVKYELTADDVAFDCQMPDDGQEILITTPWGVDIDKCEYDCTDDGMSLYSLEERGDWEDVKAWMPLPEPYKKKVKNNGL